MGHKNGITIAALNAALNGDMENAIVASAPGGIERQERQGQSTFVNASTLPKDMRGCSRADLEKMGFIFGEDDGDLFVKVDMPKGWTKQGSDHAMWSYLLDEQGRERASMLYKAAFYDRSAFISLSRRYNVSMYGEAATPDHYVTVILDGKTPIHTIGIRHRKDYATSDLHGNDATAYLNEHFPDWQNPLAYWG